MDCMKECILSIFWPKKDIMDFFKKARCNQTELLSENEYKELHRSEIVEQGIMYQPPPCRSADSHQCVP